MINYYGIAELAKMLNWTTEKTHVYYKRNKFKQPVAMVGMRPLWSKEQIEPLEKIFYFKPSK